MPSGQANEHNLGPRAHPHRRPPGAGAIAGENLEIAQPAEAGAEGAIHPPDYKILPPELAAVGVSRKLQGKTASSGMPGFCG